MDRAARAVRMEIQTQGDLGCGGFEFEDGCCSAAEDGDMYSLKSYVC